jgi:hypothetical protein
MSWQSPQNWEANCVEQLIYWNAQTAQLLKELRDLLRPTIKAWDRFSNFKGGESIFSNITGEKSRATMESIKKSFEGLFDLNERLASLGIATESSARSVSSIIQELAQN